MFIRKIGIDLGTANTLVYLPKKGVVVNEPTVVAVSLEDNRILAVGSRAKEMLGKAPDIIAVYRPMKEGVIADYRVTEAMLRYFIGKVMGRWRIFRPDIMVAVPAGITSTEKRAVVEATVKAGAKNAYVVKEPVLAAIGAGIPINSAEGNMIIDIGGGTAEIAVVALGGIVTSYSVRAAGDKMDEKIAEFIKKEYNLAIGSQTAEEIKIRVGRALPFKKEETFEVRGRDLIKGLPRNIKISANETAKAVAPVLEKIIEGIKHVLRETPPELSADIMNKGMILSGGGALLRALDQLIAKSTGVPCFVADEPLFCVVKGTGVVLENLDIYKKTIMTKK